MSICRPETDQSLRFFPPAPCSCAQAIEIVTEAIAADNAGEFEKALGLYKRRVSRASRLLSLFHSACAETGRTGAVPSGVRLAKVRKLLPARGLLLLRLTAG